MAKRIKETESFSVAYAKLAEVAEKVRSAKTPMVDELLPLIEQAVDAKKVCDARIEAVKKLLEEKFGGENRD